MSRENPTWENDVKVLFSDPYWIPVAARDNVAASWLNCMQGFLITLDDSASVKQWSVTIYDHLSSQNMPLTTDKLEHWPADALEIFRLWVNQGWRESAQSPFNHGSRIPEPSIPVPSLRIRPDIASLSEAELNRYRAKLDGLRISDPSSDSPWQKLAYIHTNWCLHYQEAFAFWHRAYLLHLEALIDHPIPYWDWMAKDASQEGSPQAGLPRAFLAETYIHPETGESLPNPLRFAAAKDGQSKLCATGKMSGPDCRYVQRNPLFYTSGPNERKQRSALYKMSEIFQQQVVDALKFKTFSVPQGDGYPWANIPAFDPPQKDSLYPYRDVNFDGLYEQPHDNYHGWIGGDMADNSYTAFDPIFYSYHANIDRMLEIWLRNNPQAQYTSQVILQPFTSPNARETNFTSADQWRYASIGEMAQDSRRIGFDYGKPVAPQFTGRQEPEQDRDHDKSASDSKVSLASEKLTSKEFDSNALWIAFDGVRCTFDSYFIDVFLNQGEHADWSMHLDNPHYVGRLSRIGMGIEDDKGRCVKEGVSRILNATQSVATLKLSSTSKIECSVRVTHIDSDRLLEEPEYRELPGFHPVLVWGDPRQEITTFAQPTSCCIN